MKHLSKVMMSLLVLLTLFSCKKQKNEPAAQLDGNWELRTAFGGNMVGSGEYAPGSGNMLKFSGNAYERYSNGTKVDYGTFVIAKEKVAINNSESNFNITFTSSNPNIFIGIMKQSINLSANKLTVFLGVIAADGVEYHYVRL